MHVYLYGSGRIGYNETHFSWTRNVWADFKTTKMEEASMKSTAIRSLAVVWPDMVIYHDQ